MCNVKCVYRFQNIIKRTLWGDIYTLMTIQRYRRKWRQNQFSWKFTSVCFLLRLLNTYLTILTPRSLHGDLKTGYHVQRRCRGHYIRLGRHIHWSISRPQHVQKMPKSQQSCRLAQSARITYWQGPSRTAWRWSSVGDASRCDAAATMGAYKGLSWLRLANFQKSSTFYKGLFICICNMNFSLLHFTSLLLLSTLTSLASSRFYRKKSPASVNTITWTGL